MSPPIRIAYNAFGAGDCVYHHIFNANTPNPCTASDFWLHIDSTIDATIFHGQDVRFIPSKRLLAKNRSDTRE